MRNLSDFHGELHRKCFPNNLLDQDQDQVTQRRIRKPTKKRINNNNDPVFQILLLSCNPQRGIIRFVVVVVSIGLDCAHYILLPPLQKKKPVDFDGELKIGDVRYDNIT